MVRRLPTLVLSLVVAAPWINTMPAQRPAQSEQPRLFATAKHAETLDRLRRAMVDQVASGWNREIFREIESRVQDFVLRQLELDPLLAQRHLRAQLRAIYGPWNSGADPEFDDAVTPFVTDARLSSELINRRAIAIAYAVGNGAHGPGMSELVVDCYATAAAAVRFVARRDGDFSGYLPRERLDLRVNNNSASFLVVGDRTGSNGLGIRRAAVYQCSADRLRLAWQTPERYGLRLTVADTFLTLRYVAEGDYLGAGGVAAWTYELYELRGYGNDPVQMKLVTKVRQRQ